jgi:hypothetical protein
VAVPMLRHRHPDRTAGRPAGPAPRARPGGGPHPVRQDTGLNRFPGCSPSTRSGCNSPSPPATSSPGHKPRCSTASWPPPNRRSCATGCCTPQPGSPSGSAASGCASTPAGHGGSTSPQRSPGCTPSRCPRPDQRPPSRPPTTRIRRHRPPRRTSGMPVKTYPCKDGHRQIEKPSVKGLLKGRG